MRVNRITPTAPLFRSNIEAGLSAINYFNAPILKLARRVPSNGRMKTKTWIAIAAVTLVAVALPVRAGVSVSISFGVPVVFHPPVVTVPPVYVPPVVVAPPRVPFCPSPVMVVRPVPPPCARVVYVPPHPVWRYDRQGHPGWGREGRGHGPGHGPGGRR